MLIEEIRSSCVYQWADDCINAFLSSNCQFNLETHINIKWIYILKLLLPVELWLIKVGKSQRTAEFSN